MDCKAECIDYADTGYFSDLILHYLKEDAGLRPFYLHSPNHPDFEKIISIRKRFPTDRKLLVSELEDAYKDLKISDALRNNIGLLSQENTFTICTAHQPNLFTGFLYFTYKILHAIKLSGYLKEQYPAYNFVPVFYMGSEDNDIEELGTVYVNGKTYRWQPDQSGAVGRMVPDERLSQMIDRILEDLGSNLYTRQLKTLLQKAYLKHKNIQEGTLYLVNELFGKFGLIGVIADTPGFKRAILPMMKEELFEQKSISIVQDTGKKLAEHFHVQATPRDINLFYLKDQLRERIVREGETWKVLNTDLVFDRAQLESELDTHPERFSPNVILRGVFQETILPDLVFIGGGGELAYWMELKALFEHFKVPFPLLLLRRSGLFVDDKSFRRLEKVGLPVTDLFGDTELLINKFVEEHTQEDLVLNPESEKIRALYAVLEEKARKIDNTLVASVGAERTRSLKSIEKLEHKFLRAEKRKFEWRTELIREVKEKLFPHNALQERKDNLLPFYAAYGPEFIEGIFKNMEPLKNKFQIFYEK